MSVEDPPTAEELEAYMRRGYDEGQGVWNVFFFNPLDVMELIAGSIIGDEFARRWLPPISKILGRIGTLTEPDKRLSPMCLTCTTRFWKECQPETIIALCPACDEPQHSTSLLLCEECTEGFQDFEAMKKAVLVACRPILGDDARELPPPVAGVGRA